MPVGSLGVMGINPTTPTQWHFVLSPVSLALRDQDGGPVELNDRRLRSHGKIGDCQQSTGRVTSAGKVTKRENRTVTKAGKG